MYFEIKNKEDGRIKRVNKETHNQQHLPASGHIQEKSKPISFGNNNKICEV